MRILNFKSVRFKIVFYTTLCLTVVGLISNLYLYAFMNNIIKEKAEAIDTLYFDTLQSQLDTQIAQIRDLAILCVSSTEVARLLNNTSLNSPTAVKNAVNAQSVLNDYLHSVNINNYVNKLMVFNESGVCVQAATHHNGTLSDYETLINSDNFKILQDPTIQPFSLILPSITPFKGEALAGLFSINTTSSRGGASYIYIELNPDIILDTLKPYAMLNNIFAVSANGTQLLSDNWAINSVPQNELDNLPETRALSESRSYNVYMRQLNNVDIKIYNFVDLSTISVESQKVIYTIIVVMLSVLLVSFCTLTIMSNYITSPIKKLIARIRRISANDFSYDPEIEKGGDEISEIGKVVNEMMLSINALLTENNRQNEERRNVEIALLQSQVNPHFLYNTLDSIHWMAVIQKNTGICNMTQSLSNLLKNLAKGTQDKITLKEELSILQDYIAIQNIRYLETFEVIINVPEDLLSMHIIKFTLQPLVENAIFHGIAPTGECGTISINAYTSEDNLFITVQDDGVGMSKETLQNLLQPKKQQSNKSSLSGIGVNNVHQRLKLVYGNGYGLSYESQLSKFTKVTVKIPKEG